MKIFVIAIALYILLLGRVYTRRKKGVTQKPPNRYRRRGFHGRAASALHDQGGRVTRYSSKVGERANKDESSRAELDYWRTQNFVGPISAVFSIVAAVAAGASAYFAFHALGLTQRAIETARDTEIRQLRAYVFIDSGRITLPSITHPIYAAVEIKNSGQTPSYDISARQ